MAVKDVELFVQEKRKNEALKKEWEETSKQEATLKEDQKEAFFNEKLYPILKKYGFDFSFNDFCEYKGNSKSQDSDEELSDDELFNVAGGGYFGENAFCNRLALMEVNNWYPKNWKPKN